MHIGTTYINISLPSIGTTYIHIFLAVY